METNSKDTNNMANKIMETTHTVIKNHLNTEETGNKTILSNTDIISHNRGQDTIDFVWKIYFWLGFGFFCNLIYLYRRTENLIY